MAASKPELPVSQLLWKVAKKFQRLPHVFVVGELSGVLSGRFDVETGSEKFKMTAAKPDVPIS